MADDLTPVELYSKVYEEPRYGMGARIRKGLAAFLGRYTDSNVRPVPPWSYADIGCGRGESLDMARKAGAELAHGYEIVPALVDSERGVFAMEAFHGNEGHIHVPGEYDVVTCADVLEHIHEDSVENLLRELWRVTRGVLFLSVSLQTDGWGPRMGLGHLHVCVKSEDWWVTVITRATGKSPRFFCLTPGHFEVDLWK